MSSKSDATPVVLCFDVEPDGRVPTSKQQMMGFDRLLGSIPDIRRSLAALTGRVVRFNWFLRMDPQIAASYGDPAWIAQTYDTAIRSLLAEGDAIGVHPHCWRWNSKKSRWAPEHDDAEWVDKCVRTSFEAYERHFGTPCRMVRFGDRFVTARGLRLAAELGAMFDVSVEPGMPGHHRLVVGPVSRGRMPSQRNAPREPYRPDASDPFGAASDIEAAAGLWEIPLTAIDTSSLIPVWRRAARAAVHPRTVRHRTAALYVQWDARLFWTLIDRHLTSSRCGYLAFAIRSDTFVGDADRKAFNEKIEALQDRVSARGLEFADPGLVVKLAQHK